MTLDELKKILEREEGKVIIIENGKPIMVIMGFEDYEKKIRSQGSPKLASFSNPKKELPKELQEEELKIEDLPI